MVIRAIKIPTVVSAGVNVDAARTSHLYHKGVIQGLGT